MAYDSTHFGLGYYEAEQRARAREQHAELARGTSRPVFFSRATETLAPDEPYIVESGVRRALSREAQANSSGEEM